MKEVFTDSDSDSEVENLYQYDKSIHHQTNSLIELNGLPQTKESMGLIKTLAEINSQEISKGKKKNVHEQRDSSISTKSRKFIMVNFLENREKNSNNFGNDFSHQKSINFPKLPRFNTEIYISRKTPRIQLEQKLNDLQQGEELPTFCAIVGLSGIGKTQFALDYAHRPPKSQSFTLKIWFQADDALTLEKEYLNFGKTVNVIDNKLTVQENISRVKFYLERYSGWLLIYDNAKDDNTLYPYLPRAPGRIIVTSQNPNWQNKVELGALDFEEAIHLIQKASGRKYEKDNGFEKLVKELGYHSLAISQAGAYINSHKISVSEYLQRFHKQTHDLLGSEDLPIGHAHVPVLITWKICFENMQNEVPDAVKLLHFCSYLYPNNIPNRLLREALLYDDGYNGLDLYEKICQKLENYSLITINPDNDTINVHSLVQTVVRLSITKVLENECIRILFNCCNKLFDYQRYYLDMSGTWAKNRKTQPLYSLLSLHIIKISNRNDYLIILPEVSIKLLLKSIQYLLYEENNYTAAYTLFEKLEQLHQCHGFAESSHSTLELLLEKANIAAYREQYDTAIMHIEKAIKMCIENYKENNTVTSYLSILYNKLGNNLFAKGAYTNAKENYNEAISVYEFKNNDEAPKNPNIAIAWCGIGDTLLAEAQYQKAEIAYNESLKIYTLLIADQAHPDIGIIYINLGRIYFEQKNYGKSLEYFQFAVEIIKKSHNHEPNVGIATCYYNISQVLIALDKNKDALKYARDALNIYSQVYKGFYHIDMIMIAFQVGFSLCRTGKYPDGIEYYKIAFTIYDQIIKEEIIKNLRVYAENYFANKDFEKSEICYLLTLEHCYIELKKKGTKIINMNLTENKKHDSPYLRIKSKTDHKLLIELCSMGSAEKVSYLCIKIHDDINEPNEEGITPLCAAAKKGHLNVVKCLIEIGKAKFEIDKINDKNDKKIPLLEACIFGHFNIVDYLIDYKLNINKAKKFDDKYGLKFGVSKNIWEHNYSYHINHSCGSPLQSNVNKNIECIVDNFFSSSSALKQQAIEILLSFDTKLLSGLYYLRQKDGFGARSKLLSEWAIKEIIVTLFFTDSITLLFLLKNSFIYKEEIIATEFLEISGMNKEFLDSFNQHKKSNKKYSLFFSDKGLQNLDEDIDEFINKSMMARFIFDSNKIKYPQSIAIILTQTDIYEHQINQLLQHLENPSAIIRMATKNLLLLFKLIDNKNTQNALIRTYSNKAWRIRHDGIELFNKARDLDKNIILHLKQVLADPVSEVRLAAAIILAKAGEVDDHVLQVITDSLTDLNWRIRLKSIKVIRKFAVFNLNILENLFYCNIDEDEEVKSYSIDTIKKISNIDHKLVSNSFEQFLISKTLCKISDNTIKLLQEISTKDDLTMGLALIKVKYENYAYNEYEKYYIENLKKLEVFKDGKEFYELLIKDVTWFSVNSLARIIAILPNFKNELFEKTIGEAGKFSLFMHQPEDIIQLCDIFPEYQDILTVLFKEFIITSPKLILNDLHLYQLERLVKNTPILKFSLFEILINDVSWRKKNLETFCKIKSLTEIFPEQAGKIFDITLNSPDWFPKARAWYYNDKYDGSCKDLYELARAFPEQQTKLFEKSVCHSIWILDSLQNEKDLLNLVNSFPDYLDEFFQKILKKSMWFSLLVNNCNILSEIAILFEKYTDYFFSKTLAKSEWRAIHLKTIHDVIILANAFTPQNDILFKLMENSDWFPSVTQDLDNLKCVSESFPKYLDILSEKTIYNSTWFADHIKKITDLIKLIEIFPEHKISLCSKTIKNPDWLLSSMENANEFISFLEFFHDLKESIFTQMIEDNKLFKLFMKVFTAHRLDCLLKVFPEQNDIIFIKTIRNPIWVLENIKYTYDLKNLLKIFPDKKAEILERTIMEPNWVSCKSLYNLEDLSEEFLEIRSTLIKFVIEDDAWILEKIKGTYDLKNLLKILPEQRHKLFEKTAESHEWFLSSIKSSYDLERLAEIFPERHLILKNLANVNLSADRMNDDEECSTERSRNSMSTTK